MYTIYIFVILVILYIFSLKKELFSNQKIDKHDHKMNKHDHKIKPKNICRGYLTDIEYLEHMIPHHQVAIDISVELQRITKSPLMHEILRKLIYNQKMEIYLMNEMKKKLPINVSDDYPKSKKYIPK